MYVQVLKYCIVLLLSYSSSEQYLVPFCKGGWIEAIEQCMANKTPSIKFGGRGESESWRPHILITHVMMKQGLSPVEWLPSRRFATQSQILGDSSLSHQLQMQ